MDIIFVICTLAYFFIFTIFCWIPGLYIEHKKYTTLQCFLERSCNFTIDEIINFIDVLHFNDREKSLSSMYKRLYKELCNDVRKMKK